MVEFRTFLDSDLDGFETAVAELTYVADWRAMTRTAALFGETWTAVHDGRIIGCGGLATLWTGRAQAWCVLGTAIPRHVWPAIHKGVRQRLAAASEKGIRRIEGEARCNFPPASRWLKLLGFEFEGLARFYGPGGEDFFRYARMTG